MTSKQAISYTKKSNKYLVYNINMFIFVSNLNYKHMNNQTSPNEFNHEAGLKVIYDMIETAKARIGKNYFYYLFWGYLVVMTSLIEYLLITVAKYPKHYLVWSVLMPLGAFITLIFYLRQKKTVTSRTYIGNTMGYFWSGWLISFALLLLFVSLRQDHLLIIPVVIAMYGMAAFVAGGVVSFRPLVIGALVAWPAAVAAYFIPYLFQLLLLPAVVIISYIIPGHLLKRMSKVL
jgi:hypothetical protein